MGCSCRKSDCTNPQKVDKNRSNNKGYTSII